MIFLSTLHLHSKYPAYTVAEWNFIWNDPCLNLVVIYVLMVAITRNTIMVPCI